jgi:hypothetical protein
MLLSPVFGFLTAIGIEMLIGVLQGAGILALFAAPVVGLIGWSILRKPWVRVTAAVTLAQENPVGTSNVRQWRGRPS